jgi:phosphoribosyl 1,2-cyclic phosphate phosphodiesterase
MIVTFLGTGAADAFPAAFCRCENCQQARTLRGPSLRKRSSLLVNDDLIIDLGPDIVAASQVHGCSLTNVRYCLQTHPHSDHLDLSHLDARSRDYGTAGAPLLSFYASTQTLRRSSETFKRDVAGYDLVSAHAEIRLNLKIHEVIPLQPFACGAYRVIGFPANHAPDMGALLYSVESGDHAIFYGTDTASLSEHTWQALHQQQMQFDLVILDHTYGPGQPESDHLSATRVMEHVQRMRRERLLRPNGHAYATHISHEGNATHPELAASARQSGYEVAYDGLVLEI